MLVVGHGVERPAVSLRTQLVDSLRFLGHEVVVADAHGDLEGDRRRLQSALVRFEPDLLINVPCETSLPAPAIRELTTATETVALCLHRGPSCTGAPTDLSELAADLYHYDLVAVPDAATFAEYRDEATFRMSLLPPAVHTPGLAAVVGSDKNGVVVVGDADPLNVDLVASLDHLDAITVVGEGWTDLPLDIDVAAGIDLVERGTVFAGARLLVELPASLSHQSRVGRHHSELGLSEAVLEAAAVGTPSVVLDRAGVAELMEPGTEVLTCESAEDLVSLVPMLLASGDELALVADAAWNCVTSRHTWVERWIELLGPWVDPHEMDLDEDVRRIAVDAAQAAASA